VVHGRLRLALDVACRLCGMLCAGAACSFIDAIIIVDRSLLVAPFVPLLASLSILLGTQDGGIGQRLPTAARCQSKSCHLGVDGVVGADTTPLFSSALGGTSQRMERSQRCPAMCATYGRPYQRLPRVTAGPPSPTELIVARFRARCSGHLFP
jgi:hypothetical protein